MTSFREILEAVIAKLKKECNEIPIVSQDVEEGFKRPSFFISIENPKIENCMTNVQEKTGDIRIVFFPTHKQKNQIEILETQELLSKTFLKDNKIWLKNGSCIEVSEADMETVDKILHFDFKIWLAEEYEREVTAENMEELVINQEVE